MNLRNQIIRYLRKIKQKIDNEYKEVFAFYIKCVQFQLKNYLLLKIDI